MSEIKQIKVSGVTYEIHAASADSINGLWVNASNNLELNAEMAGAEKINLVSIDAVQIKPGMDGEEGSVCALQLDAERGGLTTYEYPVKVCNGGIDNSKRVIGMKLNAAGLVLDTQKADTDAAAGFDKEEFEIKVRTDKWNGGVFDSSSPMGPIYLKTKARAFDFRCYDHGGIALQVAGQDSDSHENKIKFESDRTSNIAEAAAYNGEGGKGLEFGTFNNLHTSLYTGDYRFKGDAKVYAATRGELVTEDGKTDYPTQGDDFKDIISEESAATWAEIIDVAKAFKNNEIIGGMTDEEKEQYATKDYVAAEITKAKLSGSTESGTSLDGYATIDYVNETSAATYGACVAHCDEVHDELKNEINGTISSFSGSVVSYIGTPKIDATYYSKDEAEAANNSHLITDENGVEPGGEGYITTYADGYPVKKGDVKTAEIPATGEQARFEAIESRLFLKSNGNLEVSAEGLLQYDDSGNTLTDPASLDLVSDGKVAVKSSNGFSIEDVVVIPVELSKKGKLTIGNYELTSAVTTDSTSADLFTRILEHSNLQVVLSKNNIEETLPSGGKADDYVLNPNVNKNIYPEGTVLGEISILELIGLKQEIASLKERVAALEALHANPEA